jgi:hypothetical protein
MEPIQILELIKEDIRDKFDGDPLMMRTMNLVITEYKARSERLHKLGVMQAEGSDGAQGAAVGNSAAGQSGSDGVMKWCDSCGKITKWIDGDCENYKTRGGSAKGALPR